MKKIATISGYIIALAIVVTAVFKVEHFPGAGVALCLTGLLLGIYFPIYILDMAREKSEGKIRSSSIIAALCAMLNSFGITFRIWHFPGEEILLTSGLTLFSLVFIPIVFIQKSKERDSDLLMYLSGAMGISLFGLGILFKLRNWPGSPLFFAAGPALLFFLYFPRYILNDSIPSEIKQKYLRKSFFVIVIGTLLILYFFKSIEIHDLDKSVQ